MSVPVPGGTESMVIRPLDGADLTAAVALVIPSTAEIPLFRWLLGEYLDDGEAVEALATTLIAPHVLADRVQGAFADDGTLVAMVAWSGPGEPDPPLPPEAVAAAAAALPSRPQIVERFAVLRDATAAHPPAPDQAQIVLGVVRPDFRRWGVPTLLSEPVRKAARAAGVDITLTASDPALGRAHERTYGAVLQGSYRVGDVTVYRYVGPP